MAGTDDQSGCDRGGDAALQIEAEVEAAAHVGDVAAVPPVPPPRPRRDESAYLLAGSLSSFSRDQLHDLAGLGEYIRSTCTTDFLFVFFNVSFLPSN